MKGHKFGFIYREEPDEALGSGWRVISGNESQEYLDGPGHLS